MTDFTRVIRNGYLEILEREPDAGGLASYNAAMNAGLSEADMRESLLRSAEYAAKNSGFRPSRDRRSLQLRLPRLHQLRAVRPIPRGAKSLGSNAA